MSDFDSELYGETPEKREERERLEREAANLKAQLADDWKNVLATPGGRRVMWHMMQELGLFTGGGSEYATGMRDAALMIRHSTRQAGVDFWKVMFQENEK